MKPARSRERKLDTHKVNSHDKLRFTSACSFNLHRVMGVSVWRRLDSRGRGGRSLLMCKRGILRRTGVWRRWWDVHYTHVALRRVAWRLRSVNRRRRIEDLTRWRMAHRLTRRRHHLRWCSDRKRAIRGDRRAARMISVAWRTTELIGIHRKRGRRSVRRWRRRRRGRTYRALRRR